MNNDIFENSKTIAVIGLSDNPEKHSYKVATYFQKQGFRIIPVNPKLKEVLGEKAYPDLLSIPKEIKVDIVDVFRRSDEVLPHLKEVLKRGGISTVWLQEGVGSQEAEDFAKKSDISLVSNFCMMEVHRNTQEFKNE
jgi:hypothetical protein